LPFATTARARRRWLGVVLTLLLIAVMVAGAVALVQRARAPAAGGAPGGFGPGPGGGGGGGGVTVGATRAVQGDLPVLIDALGTVTPPITATLVPQVSGVLTEVLFTEGQMVSKGQVLARIDVRPYEQTLLQTRGTRAPRRSWPRPR
jgi:multidrug efflux system membrane fusion protein